MNYIQSNSHNFFIQPKNVPESLEDVPLPIEIFGPDDKLSWTVVQLLEDEKTEVKTSNFGIYDLRAELPSGEWIRLQIDIPESSNQPPSIILDLKKLEDISNEIGQAKVINPPKRTIKRFLSSIFSRWFSTKLPDKKEPIQFKGWLFEKWDEPKNNEKESICLRCKPALKLHGMQLSLQTKLKEHLGWSEIGRERRPMLLETEYNYLDNSNIEESSAVLVILPPAAREPCVTFSPNLNPHPDPSVPRLLVSVESDSPAANALFSYVRSGSFEAARLALPFVKRQAMEMLFEKENYPVSATIAAYTLYRLGDREQLDWISNLANWFKFMPDGAVIYGSYMIQEGKFDEAWKYFRIAFDRGIPMYSEGLKLLCDGLIFLSRILTNDPLVQKYATQAFKLAALANLESELTCLRLDRKFLEIIAI